MLVKPFTYYNSTNNTFVIRKNKKHAFLFFLIALLIGILSTVSAYFEFLEKAYFAFTILALFGVTSIIWMLNAIRLTIRGEVFLFDNISKLVFRNMMQKVRYSDISNVVMEEKNSDGSWYYLYLLKINGSKLPIADMSIDTYLIETGKAIEIFTNITFIQKLI
jgi:diacylglycerol kinase family enzyme